MLYREIYESMTPGPSLAHLPFRILLSVFSFLLCWLSPSFSLQFCYLGIVIDFYCCPCLVLFDHGRNSTFIRI